MPPPGPEDEASPSAPGAFDPSQEAADSPHDEDLTREDVGSIVNDAGVLLDQASIDVKQPRRVQVVLSVVFALSAGGFALAASAERSKEAGVSGGLTAPEGSAAREAAERGGQLTPTTARSPSPTPSTERPVQSSTTSISPTTLPPEGSPAREASERAARTSTTVPPPTTAASILSATGDPTTTAPTTSSPASTRAPASKQGTRLSRETLFGVHTESAGATLAGVAPLLTAAVVVLLTRRRWAFMAVAALAGGFALLDVREASHQHDEARATLVAAAVALALTHMLACALGLVASRSSDPGPKTVVERR